MSSKLIGTIADFLPKSKVKVPQLLLHIPYFLQKCKKGKPYEMDLPFFENEITTFELALKYGIHSETVEKV